MRYLSLKKKPQNPQKYHDNDQKKETMLPIKRFSGGSIVFFRLDGRFDGKKYCAPPVRGAERRARIDKGARNTL